MGREYARLLYISSRVRAQNAWVQLPELGQRCGFCSACHHTFSFGLMRVACPYAHAAHCYDGVLSAFDRCQYQHCQIRHLHYTRVCPTLHSLGLSCGLCGHQGNHSLAQEWMVRALSDFEAAANQGVFTCQRHQETAWGSYPSYGTAEEPSYSDLFSMDVLRAYVYSSFLCPRHITHVKLWCPAQKNTERCHSNRPEGYVLSSDKNDYSVQWTDQGIMNISNEQIGPC